jgi:hypothetical protein
MFVWVAYTHYNGYPTPPLGVYSSPVVGITNLGGRDWREVPAGWGGRGGWTGYDQEGAALDLVRMEVEDEMKPPPTPCDCEEIPDAGSVPFVVIKPGSKGALIWWNDEWVHVGTEPPRW